MNVEDFRAQYPHYDDMSDTDLAHALHGKYYQDVPKGNFLTNFLDGVTKKVGDTVEGVKQYAGDVAEGWKQIANSPSPMQTYGQAAKDFGQNRLDTFKAQQAQLQSMRATGDPDKITASYMADPVVNAFGGVLGTMKPLAAAIPPGGFVNSITRQQAGKMMAQGEPSVLGHLKKGMQEGIDPMQMQDAVRNQIMDEIATAPRGPMRDAVRQNIQKVEPEINKLFKQEVKPSYGVEVPDHVARAVQAPRVVPQSVGVQTKQLTKDTLNNAFEEGVVRPTQPIRLTTVDEINSIGKTGRMTPGKSFEGVEGISAQITGNKKPIVAYGDNNKVSAAIIFPEKSVIGKGLGPNEVKIGHNVPVHDLLFVLDGYKRVLTYPELTELLKSGK